MHDLTQPNLLYQDDDAPPPLTMKEQEDLERAEKEAQQKKVPKKE